MDKHIKNNHGGGHSCSRKPVIPVLKPFQFRDSPADQKKTLITRVGERESESLFIASLSNNQLIHLALNTVSSKRTVLACIGALILRGQDDGLKNSLALWRQRKINDDDILELLGYNPETAYTYLDKLPLAQKPTQLLIALANRYPVETLNIKPGMFIKTPAGWGEIKFIQDDQNNILDFASVEASNIKIKLTLHPKTNPENATADMVQRKLIFPGYKTYKCDLCGSCISANDKYIYGKHTQSEHPGKKPVFSMLYSSISYPRILEFTTELK